MRIDSASAMNRPRKSSAIDSCRMSREPAMQAWPWLWKIANAEPLTAASMSASAKTMLAPLPPSSSWTRFTLPADSSTMRRPVGVDPVNAILRTPGWPPGARPRRGPCPGTMLTTPGGKPTSAISSATRSEVSGVSSAGLRTTVLPAASAGPIFQLQNISGKFHGTIIPTTPSGSRRT